MPTTFKDVQVNGRVTQSQAAVNADHLLRKGEADTALAGKASTSDARFTDARPPTGSVPGSSDLEGTWQGGPTLKAIVAAEASGATKVTYDAKGRITGKLTPGASDVPAHAANHKSGGSDPIRLDELAAPTSSVALNSQRMTGVQDPSSAQDAATKAYVDARRLDQAAAPTNAVGLNGQKLTGVADPTAAQEAATKAYVDARRLDQAAAPTGAVALNSQRLTGVQDPAAAQDAATKAYVDAAVQGLGNKASVRLATTGNHALSGLGAIDGVTPVAGDRVLVKTQSDGAQNGIYTAAAGAWTRATDADLSAEVQAGLYVFVEEGAVNGDSGWQLTTNNPITLGTTPLTFVQFTGAGQITAGAGLVKSGNQLSVDFAATATAGKACEANDTRLSDARQMAPASADLNANSHRVVNVTDPAAAQDAATKAYVDARRLDQAAAPTGAVPLNGQKLTGVADPTTAQDAATKAYVDARRLDQAVAPTSAVALNGQKLTGVGDPTAAQDAVTKAYLESAIAGFSNKAAVRLATTANHGLSGLAAIDGVTPVAGDRVLVKNQSDGTQNGIYTAAAGAWTRATDADISAEVRAGLYVFVQEGTVNGDSGWQLSTNDPITLGTTVLTFVQFTGAGQITAGAGLVKNGNQLSVDFAATATAGKACEANDPRLSDARQMAPATGSVNFNSQKGTNVATPTADADAANKLYVDNGDRTGKLVWVDSVNGNDATGARGKANLPFQTCLAAKAAASSGDTIVVLPGTYFDGNLLKNGVNWHFLPGAELDVAGSDIFNDDATGANGAAVCRITGWGRFAVDDPRVLHVTHAGSNIYVEALEIVGTAEIGKYSVELKAGTARLVVKRGVANTNGAAVRVAGGTHSIEAQTIGGVLLESGATQITVVRADLIDGAALGPGVNANEFSGEAEIEARLIKSSSDVGVKYLEDGPALLTIHRARIISTLASASGKAVQADGANLTLKDVVLVGNTVGTPASASIDAGTSTNVRLYGCGMANIAKGANITFITGSTRFEVDADVR